jgi:hypothetical protein
MTYPNDAAVVERAMRQARGMSLRPYPHGLSALTPPVGGSAWGPDSYGNSGVNNADGTNYRLDMALGNKAAWMQPAVYIAAGAGLLIGAIGFYAYTKKGGK